jgi:hypothetical protein
MKRILLLIAAVAGLSAFAAQPAKADVGFSISVGPGYYGPYYGGYPAYYRGYYPYSGYGPYYRGYYHRRPYGNWYWRRRYHRWHHWD